VIERLDAALVLLFTLVASRQIKLRRIDGWRKLGLREVKQRLASE